jgi:hypothetical protein
MSINVENKAKIMVQAVSAIKKGEVYWCTGVKYKSLCVDPDSLKKRSCSGCKAVNLAESTLDVAMANVGRGKFRKVDKYV